MDEDKRGERRGSIRRKTVKWKGGKRKRDSEEEGR